MGNQIMPRGEGVFSSPIHAYSIILIFLSQGNHAIKIIWGVLILTLCMLMPFVSEYF
jgi:hypothetical protein